MFEKLLANLPFSPSLVHELAFYGKRMRQEASIRRLGLIFVVLAFFVQFFAVLSPPQPTMARSNNDMINGGIRSVSEAVAACTQNISNYREVLNNFGISCDDVAASTTKTIKSTDFGGQLYSMGRLPYGKRGETPITIAGKTYYVRPLSAWDTRAYSTYKVLEGKSSQTGKTFYIIYDCGNLTTVGIPVPPERCIWNNDVFATDARCQAPKCALDASLPADSPECKSCPYDSNILKNNSRCVACPYLGSGNITRDNPLCKAPCPYDSSLSSDSPQCRPCSASQTRDDKTACLELSKTASNTTQGLTDANGTTAAGGDVIVYTLQAKNTGKARVDNFVIQEDISDVLDYATVLDVHGGTLDGNSHIVSYEPQDIAAGATASGKITVKVKNPLPDTPVSTSDPGHYDLAMTNVYGNTVNIKLPPSIIKTSEQIVTELPNTGPGTSLMISLAISSIAAYFFARARLLTKETNLAIHENIPVGEQA